MEDFFRLFDRQVGIRLELGYSRITDYTIRVGDSKDDTIFIIQDTDYNYCFAKAYVALADWLSENRGGY